MSTVTRRPGFLAGDECDVAPILDPDVECAPAADVKALAEAAWAKHTEGLFARSPFWARKYGMSAGQFAKIGLDQLGELPIVTKSELKVAQEEHRPFGDYLGVPLSDVKRVYQTSGTTGSPSILALTRDDVDNVWGAIARRCYFATGIHSHSRVLTTYPAGPFVAGHTHGVLDGLGACSIPVAPGDTPRVMSAMERGLCDTLMGTATFALYLASLIESRGIDGPGLGVTHVITGGEPGGGVPAIRDRIEAAFGAKVTEGMGLGDITPSLFGECPEGGGMHFMGQGHIWPELIDPVTGENIPIEPGARGEPVYTHLSRNAMPLIRFRSGDIVEIQEGGCPCGRTSFRIRCVGRADDMFIVRGVNVYPAAVQEVVAAFQPIVSGRSRVVLTTKEVTVDPPVLIEVEVDQPDGATPELAARMEQDLRDRLIFRAKIAFITDGTFGDAGYKTRAIERRLGN